MSFDIANDETAAIKIDEYREIVLRGWVVDAKSKLPVCDLDVALFGLMDRGVFAK